MPRIEKVQYLGVTPAVQANGRVAWKVQNKYNTDKWRYDTQLEAARAVARSEGLTLADIKHDKARFTMLSKRKQQEIHGPAMALYCNKRPGDCENLDMHAKRPKTWKALERFPGIIPAFLIAKVAADRCDVVASANEVRQKTKGSCAKSRADQEKLHYTLFVLAARKISKHRWSKAEEKSIGKNNFHWMNYHTMLQHLRIRSLKESDGNGTNPLVFQNSGTKYYVCAWNHTIKQRLENHIAWGRSCMALRDRLPEVAEEFVDCVAAIDVGVQKLVGAQKDSGYSRLWLKRGWVRFLLIGYDIKIDFRNLALRQFIKCWPDEHGLLVGLLSDEHKTLTGNLDAAVGKGLKRLHYKDEPELLSMHACLINDWDAQTVLRQKGEDWVRRNSKELTRRLNAWHRRDGIWPHPGIFFLDCWHLE